MSRKAFTLVELLVVLSIIALIAGLLVFVMPGFQDRSRAAKGGQALQGWLNYARTRAMHERAPRGIRLLFKTQTFATNPNPPGTTLTFVSEAQYLEQPDDYMGGALYMPDPNKKKEIVFEGTNLDGLVEPGDALEVFGVGVPRVIPSLDQFANPIQNPQASNPMKPTFLDKLVFASDLPFTIPFDQRTKDYKIMRRARVAGDEPMTMPAGILVDLNIVQKYAAFGGFYPKFFFSDPPNNKSGSIDLMFSPAGALLETGGDKLILWVRKEPPQAGVDNEFDGNPTLIVVYVNSGAVAAYNPVTPADGPDPYVNVK